MRSDAKRINRRGGCSKSRRRLLAAPAVLLCVFGCAGIWNAGDLAVWVRGQAVEEGCRRETIQLEEWYSKTNDGNVWRGTCIDDQNNPMAFEINVDSVWTPSAE